MIAKYLRKYAPDLECYGLESGSTSAWLRREFRGMGLSVICLDSRNAHRALSMKRNKNDRNDARGLADLVRMGWYREARVRSIDAQFVRSLLLSRQQLLKLPRAIQNQIRRAPKMLGAMTGRTKGRGFMPRDWLGPVTSDASSRRSHILRRVGDLLKNLAPGIDRCVWSELPSTSCDPQSPLFTRVGPRLLHAKIVCALQPAPVRM